MKEGQASRTAELVAFARAVHQVVDRPLVLDDPIAPERMPRPSAASSVRIRSASRASFELQHSEAAPRVDADHRWRNGCWVGVRVSAGTVCAGPVPGPVAEVPVRDAYDDDFARACALEEAGDFKAALRLLVRLVSAGDPSVAVNVGYYYDVGLGVRKSAEKALYWYRKAYRHGVASAAHYIGTVYRDQERYRLAERWFVKALAMGDDAGALELAKIAATRGHVAAARRHLRRVLRSQTVAEVDIEAAQALKEELESSTVAMSGRERTGARRPRRSVRPSR